LGRFEISCPVCTPPGVNPEPAPISIGAKTCARNRRT
jgi:hypothetical protein